MPVDEVLALLAVDALAFDAEVLVLVHVAFGLLLTAGWRLARAAAPPAVRASVAPARHATAFAGFSLATATCGRHSGRGPPARA